MEAWASYFQESASPADHGYDSTCTCTCTFAQALAEQYRILCELPLDELLKFTCNEGKEVIHSLKLDKAIILSGHIISQSLCHGLVIPIPKGLNKDLHVHVSNPSTRASLSYPTSARSWRSSCSIKLANWNHLFT